MSRHWATTSEAGTVAGMRFMIWVNSLLGRRVFNFFLVIAMAYFFLRRTDARRASRSFLRRVQRRYPGVLKRAPLICLSYQHFYIFGHSLLDRYLAWAATPSEISIDPVDERMLFDAAARNHGCLLIGSHFGNIEYSRGIAHKHPDLTINVLLYDQHAQKFARIIEQGDPESRMNLIQVTDIDFRLALKLKEKVQRGEWVVIAGDRVPVGESGRTSGARFFGDTAYFPIGPYVLASLLECPVYLLHCYRLDDDYHLRVELFADNIRIERGNRQTEYARYAQKFATALETQVASAPLQWFNFFDFWDAPDATVRRNQASTGPGKA